MTLHARFLALAVGLLPLAGCGSLFGEAAAPAPTVYDDVPVAAELTDERSQELYLIVVQNLRKEGQSYAALAYLDDYDNRFPGDPRSALLRADCLVDVGATAEAAAIYSDYLDDDALAPAAHAGLGHVAAAAKDWHGAETEFAEAVRRQPVNPKYLNAFGFSQLMTSDFKGAIFTLRKATELAPANATFRNNLVLALHLAGQDAEAEAVIQRIEVAAEREAAERMLRLSGTELGLLPGQGPAEPKAGMAATRPSLSPQGGEVIAATALDAQPAAQPAAPAVAGNNSVEN